MRKIPTPQEKAKQIVRQYVWAHYKENIPAGDIYTVWFCKALQNWKALLYTPMTAGAYYELTYDGDEEKTYLDVYQEQENLTYPDYMEDATI